MMKVKALRTNDTLKFTKDKDYEARISQQCNSILFITNDLGDNVVASYYDFDCCLTRKGVKNK